MTMAKLRIKMIPARIIREKGKESAVTPQRGAGALLRISTKSYSGKDVEDRSCKSLGFGTPLG